jgi:hypothetical protein
MARVMKALPRDVRAITSGTAKHHRKIRRRLFDIALATLVVDAVGTLLVFLFDKGAHGSEITNLGDSLFWTTSQLLTVSSQMSNPISTGARIIDVFLELYAITVVVALVGSFAAFYHLEFQETEEA